YGLYISTNASSGNASSYKGGATLPFSSDYFVMVNGTSDCNVFNSSYDNIGSCNASNSSNQIELRVNLTLINLSVNDVINISFETGSSSASYDFASDLDSFLEYTVNAGNALPLITNVNWMTTGGFTDDTLSFLQVIDFINVNVTEADDDPLTVNISVYDPDNTAVVDNQVMTNNTYSNWTYSTDFTLDKAGTWTINITAFDNITSVIESTTFTVSIQNQSLIDGWYGFSERTIMSAANISNYANWGYDLYEMVDNSSSLSNNWGNMLDAINNSKTQNIKAGLNYLMNFNYSNQSQIDDFKNNISANFSDLLSSPYRETLEYISLETVNESDYNDGNLSSAINDVAYTIINITENAFVVYSKYNSSNLDSSYVQYTEMLYIEEGTEPALINKLAALMRNTTSLNRIYISNGTSMNSTLRDIAKTHDEQIITKLTAQINTSTGIPDSRVAELTNGDLVVFNNQSSTQEITVNVSNGTAAPLNEDIWDSTNDLLIINNLVDNITLNVSSYSAVLLYTEDLFSIALTSETQGSVYKQTAPLTGSFNYTNGTRRGSWPTNASDRARIELWNPNYIRGGNSKNFLIYYGWLNASETGTGLMTNPEGFDDYDIVIIADKNDGEIDQFNWSSTEYYGYISVGDYNDTNETWVADKKAEVDAWLALNDSMHLFVDGLDAATIVNQTKFEQDMKNLSDYITITMDRKEILNTYTQYETFATWADYVLKESCVARWNGDDSANPTNYSWENWELELNKSQWYQSHNVEVLCMAFHNTTNQSIREDIFLASRILGYEYFYLSTPDFQNATEEYFYDVGTDLEKTYTTTDNITYTRRYSEGIITFNSSSNTS
nr:hypothetical protein [Nanoarchaeota archaeon]